MYQLKPMEVVFTTNFSDPCFRSVPSVAQLADEFDIRLTLLHAYDPDKSSRANAEATLQSFFPEADSYASTQRVVVEGDPLEALRQLSDLQAIDLVISPSSDTLGLPRIGHRSTRARIIHELGAPTWSMSRNVSQAKLGRPARNIACWMEFGSSDTIHLAHAAEFAQASNAKLHLFHLLPEISEAMLSPQVSAHPLYEQGARKELRRLLGASLPASQFHIHQENDVRLPEFVKKHEIDLVFAAITKSPLTSWFTSGLREFDRCDCPVICVDSGLETCWDLLSRKQQRLMKETFRQTAALAS